jgi:hypothetical protein
MKTIKLSEVMGTISLYTENHQDKKPMMFWFRSNPDIDGIIRQINDTPSYSKFRGHPLKLGNEYMILDGRTVKIADYPELVESFIFPSSLKDTTKLFVYHEYIGQLNTEAMKYCLDVVNIGKYPVVCLMNDYSLTLDKPSVELLAFVSEHFDQYDVIH